MSVISHVQEPNLWDLICKDFASRKPPFQDDDAMSVHTEYSDFDPGKHNPVFYGNMHQKVEVDSEPFEEVDISMGHTSCAGYAFVEKPPKSPSPPPPPAPNKDTCTHREYLEHYIFPILLPGLEEMLKQAKLEKCFERKRTKFNALDFLTEYLWGWNPLYKDRDGIPLLEIPFVKTWLKDHPRPPLPLSLIWTEEEAALVIQSFWRGYQVRKTPEIQELRIWQREWREENANVTIKVSDFWAKQMPEGEGFSPCQSDQVIPDSSATSSQVQDKPDTVNSSDPDTSHVQLEVDSSQVSQHATDAD
ncbi:IQ domain-containing protein K-like [Liolophura sinensis]|uniref:IQ domain-containing protein K-like n=1 Tax=Liolophura sinensis TaxID=3198878 RepID=UPI0031598DA4